MSENQIKEALEQKELTAEKEEELQDQYEEEQLPELSAVEQKAWNQGWRPEEQFEGNPDNWKSADSYILYGEMQEQIREVKSASSRKEAEFEERLKNLNKLHEAQTAAAINDLKAKQRQAVEEADTAEFDRLQGQIDDHQAAEPAPSEPARDPAIEAWEAANPWVNDPASEKGQQAIALYNVAAAKPGATPQSALDYVDTQLAKLHPSEPPTNPRREMPTMTEQGNTRPTGRRRSKDLTMGDLTASELNDWKSFGHMMYSDEKQFLKTVADARKEK